MPAKLTEEKAWEYIAKLFEVPNCYIYGICSRIFRLKYKNRITRTTQRIMTRKIHNAIERINPGSAFLWNEFNEEASKKRAKFCRERIKQIKKAK
jgi:LytS/YehU family sensor histidine kinase